LCQPELSTIGSHVQLLSVIVQKAGQKYISMRPKQVLAVLKVAGKELSRPKVVKQES